MRLFSFHIPAIVLRLCGAALLTAFGLLSIFIELGRLVTTDFTLMVKIQDNVPRRFDHLLATLVEFGSMEILSLALLILLVFLPVRKRFKALLLGVYVLGLVAVLAGKLFLHHPAPPYMFHRDAVGLSFPSTHVQVQYSYPSGHTYRSVFVATVGTLWVLSARRSDLVKCAVVGIATVLAASVAGSLVILGKHWVTDVIGGALLATGLLLLVYPIRVQK